MKHDWEPVDNQGYTMECCRCGAHIYIESPEWDEEFDDDCPGTYMAVRAMDKEYLAKLCDARDTLCGFCEVDECEKCIVTHLIDDAYSEMPDDDDDD